jgi:hypothetical protein
VNSRSAARYRVTPCDYAVTKATATDRVAAGLHMPAGSRVTAVNDAVARSAARNDMTADDSVTPSAAGNSVSAPAGADNVAAYACRVAEPTARLNVARVAADDAVPAGRGMPRSAARLDVARATARYGMARSALAAQLSMPRAASAKRVT